VSWKLVWPEVLFAFVDHLTVLTRHDLKHLQNLAIRRDL
jgi:hypothetical protein